MKIAIIGCSGHYYYVLEGMKHFHDSFICGLAPGNANEDMSELRSKVRSIYPEAAYFDNYNEMLEKTSPDITVVNPYFYLNGKVTADALKAGSHVFAEKPVATKLNELGHIGKLAAEHRKEIVAMFGSRYYPWFLTLKQHVGEIGKPLLISAQKSYRLGDRPPFYRQRDTFGGLIPWIGSHAIDWIRWLTGDQFQTVTAAHSSSDNKNHGDMETRAVCQFTMTHNILASVTIDYLRPDQTPTHDDDRIRIAGTEGIIEILHEKVYLTDAEGIKELPLCEGKNIFVEMLKCIQDGRPCDISPEDSLRVSEVCLKARNAADNARKYNL